MKNKFLVLLFALVMILGVVGCSKKANDNANTNEQTAQEDTADKVVDENYYNVDVYKRQLRLYKGGRKI